MVTIATRANASGTSVGNGGDPLLYFLETTRYALRQTLTFLDSDPASNEKICDSLQNLTPDQRADCTLFAQQVLKPILALNVPLNPTPFVLRDEPLIVIGPDGNPMPVAARTELGPQGPIEFHRPSIALLSPSQMVLLMAHEFGHKAAFRGANVEDNPPVMSFPNGRLLLDSFGAAISSWAMTKGYITSNFTLLDLFNCEIANSGGSFRSSTWIPRKFAGNNFGTYEITIGFLPTDPIKIEGTELDGNTLHLRLRVSETKSCLEDNAGRKSELEVIRLFAGEQRTELVAHSDFPGFNPICDPAKNNLTIEASGFRFTCAYSGTSEGVIAK